MKRYAAVSMLFVSPATAQEFNLLRDDAFGYEIPIPAAYELSLRPEAGNSRLYHNPQGDILAVWAGDVGASGFREAVRQRMRRDEDEGWDITYERITADWASYSGIQADQIRYLRAIRYCGDRMAYFLVDYALSQKERYDPIVTHMVRRLRPSGSC
ncbi:hypothetical protein [Aliihoeflea sp. 40Bstr573]|uniref:hypothetical protein n=1 Tax=Aliihoeflea sp. 40Bstr573 TaxID=2696467 RepID=UPI0020963894|nr:hypothetical protein [Aliihoeflea sp. 40Bstr573]MCO6388420.1 hypothetical protein [Aliihoeflea sp. 40Bstr573]